MSILRRKVILGPSNCLHNKKEKGLVVMPKTTYDTGASAVQTVCRSGKVPIF